MVSKKTRNLIGSILVWGGLIAYGSQVGYLIYQGSKGDATMLKTGLWNIAPLLAILVGGLWGMRR